MRPLSASELLSVWERGQGQSSVARALLLLDAASPDESPAKLSVGRRDALLLSLREKLFGPQLVSLVACPNCSERLELTFESSEIRATTGDDKAETLTVKAGGYEARFRLPNSEDLLEVAAGAQRDAASASESLLSRCLLQARRKGRGQSPVSVESARDLPPDLLAAIAEKMEQADPQANVRLNLNCDACGHRWSATFDIVSYLWSEIDDWARRILREVHTLASAYGWREADILGMSARRRMMYLQLLGVYSGLQLCVWDNLSGRAEPLPHIGRRSREEEMADYLTNLLDRAFDRAAVIRPPRASLFAPTPPPFGANSDARLPFDIDERADTVDMIGESDVARLRGRRAPQPSRQNSSHRPDAETFNEPYAGHVTASTRAPREAARRESTVAQMPVTSARAQSARADAKVETKSSPRENDLKTSPLETIRAPEAPRHKAPHSEASRPEASRSESTHDEEGLLAKMRALIPKPSPDAPSHEDDRAERKSSPAPAVEAQAKEKIEGRAVARQPSVFDNKPDEAPPSPPIMPRLPPPPPPPPPLLLSLQPAMPAPASPTIQVTIGRIEVRAFSAPPPPRKPAGGPRLTLEAYLKQRDGHNGGAQ